MKTYENFITDLFKKKLNPVKILYSFSDRLGNTIRNNILGIPYIHNDLDTIITNYSILDYTVKRPANKLFLSIELLNTGVFVNRLILIFDEKYNFKKWPKKNDIHIVDASYESPSFPQGYFGRVNLINKEIISFLEDSLFNPDLKYDFDYKTYFKRLIEENKSSNNIYNNIFTKKSNGDGGFTFIKIRHDLQDWLLENYPGEYDKLEKCIFPDLKEKYSHLNNDLF